jgi:hypothetical protein
MHARARPRKLRVLVTALAIGAALFGTSATVTTGGDKVAICHATGSATNPYVLIEVSVNANDGEMLNDHSMHGDLEPIGGKCDFET